MRILQEKNRMGWSQNRPTRDTTFTRQFGRNKKDQHTKKRKRTKIIPGSNSILVKIHRKPINEYKTYYKQLSTRFGVVFYDDRIIIPKSLRTTIIMLLHKGHAAINKMTTTAKPFWWPRMTRDIQQNVTSVFRAKWQVRTLNHNYQ